MHTGDMVQPGHCTALPGMCLVEARLVTGHLLDGLAHCLRGALDVGFYHQRQEPSVRSALHASSGVRLLPQQDDNHNASVRVRLRDVTDD